MFDYCKKSELSLNTTIGTFLSHNVKWTEEDGSLVSVETVNSWDREDIARRYLHEYLCHESYDPDMNKIGGKSNESLFIKDVATKIDEFIPRRYFIKYHQINKTDLYTGSNDLQNSFLGKDEHEITKDLIYTYEENEGKKPFIYVAEEKPATVKQISFLNSLAQKGGFVVINTDTLSLPKAGELINFLLGKGKEPNDMFKYLTYQ